MLVKETAILRMPNPNSPKPALFANAFHPLKQQVLRRYKDHTWLTRFYAWYRWCVSPYSEVAEAVPSQGAVVDMGCGFGLLANTIRERHPGASVMGIDLDQRRIESARLTIRDDQRLSFQSEDWFTPGYAGVSTFIFMDVLHHLTPTMQIEVLQFCADHLPVGGAILIKDVDTEPRWKYLCNWIFDRATAITGVTKGAMLSYRSSKAWAQLGKDIHLAPEFIALNHIDYAPHFLLRLVKV